MNNDLTEEWKVIEGAQFYEVSSWGRVRRSFRQQTQVRGGTEYLHTYPMRVLRPRTTRNGYLHVALGPPAKNHSVHRLVCIAFKGWPPTPLHEVNHEDSDKTNNRATNLTWVTKAENQQHRHRRDTNG